MICPQRKLLFRVIQVKDLFFLFPLTSGLEDTSCSKGIFFVVVVMAAYL